MCDGKYVEPEAPESKLARIMNRDLGTAVTARELRLFVKAHWSKITTLAHAIHDTTD